MDKQEVNNNLIRFWDETIRLPEEFEGQTEMCDYEELAPSRKLFVAASELGACQKVLDYGCGNGWASIIIAKNGCRDVTSVDLGHNIIKTASFYFKAYGIEEIAHPFVVSSNWLENVPDGSFDGVFCSNVLDVVTLDVSQFIIKEISRVLTKGGSAVIGLNFFMSEEAARKRGVELVEGRYLFVNDVLRLNSLSDDGWAELFSPYFEITSLEHFAWPGETQETRRLFRLRKR